MFFIGPINSVLPYIIYLFLIWAFLLIGFTGKVFHSRHSLFHKPVYANLDAAKNDDGKITWFYDHEPGKDTHTAIQSTIIHLADIYYPSVCRDYPPVYSCEIKPGYNYSPNGFRGPPLLFF